jgi:hypothetical protein
LSTVSAKLHFYTVSWKFCISGLNGKRFVCMKVNDYRIIRVAHSTGRTLLDALKSDDYIVLFKSANN